MDRLMEIGTQKSFVIPPLFALMYEGDKPLKRRQPLLTVWHLLVTPTKISEQRRGRPKISRLAFRSDECLYRLEEEIARMKKNQERRLHRKNAKIVKEGGTPMQLNRPVKPDTTVRNLV
jgi:hypothetical protein